MVDNLVQREIDIQDVVSDQYENIRYLKKYSRMYQDVWYKEIASFVQQKNCLVLDNGCGVGYLSNFIPKNQIVGFDISSRMLYHAKCRMDLLVRGDSQRLPFKNMSFDTIICRGILHHLPNSSLCIQEMKRILKPGGKIILTEPIRSLITILPRKLTRGNGHFSDLHKDFKEQELIEITNSAFHIERVKYFGYIAYPILGFPDIVDPMKIIPCKQTVASALIHADQIISTIPILKNQAWMIFILAKKI